MLIDHPDVGREIFNSSGAYPTHEGAAAIFTELAGEMDDYSRRYGAIADIAWEKEFSGATEETKRAGKAGK